MSLLVALVALLLIAGILWDAFETILLPRRSPSQWRLSRLVLRTLWAAVADRISNRSRRESFLSFYAQLSILALLIVWAVGLIVGFAMLTWADGSQLTGVPLQGFAADLYMSGTTFFTLGLGDLHPLSVGSRVVTVVEAGTGFGFLALVIAYVPVLYQSFSRRETRITMLDEWAGSPPTAAVLLRRCFESQDRRAIEPLLKDWETSAAEILESHLSYPVLCYFRSQHDNQSWLASLVAILDACALITVGVEGIDPFQARLTFAIGRHALVDLCQNFHLRPEPETTPRLSAETLRELRAWLRQADVPLKDDAEADQRLTELTEMYMP